MDVHPRTIIGVLITLGAGLFLFYHPEFEPEHLLVVPVISEFSRGWLSGEYLILFAVYLGGLVGVLIRLIRKPRRPEDTNPQQPPQEPRVRVINQRRGIPPRQRNALERYLNGD